MAVRGPALTVVRTGYAKEPCDTGSLSCHHAWAEGDAQKVERKEERDHTMANTHVWSQLHEELTRDPRTFLRHLSACLH